MDGTKVSVNGVARKEGYIAIAKELKMGEYMELSLGNHTIEIPENAVKTEQEGGNGGLYECNIGLKTLILFDSVRFNLVDFVLTTEISKDYKSSQTQR